MRPHTVAQSRREGQGNWSSTRLEQLFEQCFFATYRTLLAGGAEEPLYRPGNNDQPHRILYTRDYFRSALHEVAHWCIAGPARRLREDYGYWYAPDGRSPRQQEEFERVETAPQALELIFCAACGHDFSVSLDNLDGGAANAAAFETRVFNQAASLLERGLTGRAWQWAHALERDYHGQPHSQGAGPCCGLPGVEALREVFRPL